MMLPKPKVMFGLAGDFDNSYYVYYEDYQKLEKLYLKAIGNTTPQLRARDDRLIKSTGCLSSDIKEYSEKEYR